MADIRTIKTLKEDVKAAFAADPEGYLKRLFPNGRREGNRFKIGDIDGNKGRSLSIALDTDNPGMGFDHQTGEKIGDVIDLYAKFYGCPVKGPGFKETLKAMASDFDVEERLNGHAKPNGQEIFESEWSYYGHNGKLWSLVKRSIDENGKKEIRPYWPTGQKGLPPYDGLRPLYNLSGVRETSSILVVEGEKCVDAALSLGIPATTSLGGASQASKSDWSLLDGKHVYLWPDNDDTGIKYVNDVAKLCEGALSISIVSVPDGKPEKWDIADALAEGIDVKALLRGAKQFQEEWPNIFWVEDLEGIEPSTREFIIDQWLPRGHVTSLYGKGGSGKSLLAQQMANCVASGEMFFNCPVDSGPVIAVFAEDTKDEYHRRQNDICKRLVITYKNSKMCCICLGMRPKENPDFYMIDFPNGQANNDWLMTKDLDFLCKKIKPKLVVLDNIAKLFGGNENDRSQVSYWMNRLNALAQEHNTAILLLGHYRKGSNDFSGSTAWEASVRSLCQFESMGDDEGSPMRLELVKCNYSKRKALLLKWDQGSFKMAGQMSEEEILEREAKDLAAEAAVLSAIPKLNGLSQYTSHKLRAGNRLDKVMARFQLDNGLSGHILMQTLDKLIKAGRVAVDQPIGQSKTRHKVLSLAVVLEPLVEGEH